jgi:hypothetical protein
LRLLRVLMQTPKLLLLPLLLLLTTTSYLDGHTA